MEADQIRMEAESQRAVECKINVGYITTLPGILKIITLVLTIIAFGCAANTSGYYDFGGFGFVSFVNFSAFFEALFYLIINMIMVVNLRWNMVIQLVIYAVWCLFFFIAGIVAAATSKGFGVAGAAAAFTWFAFVVWVIDTVFQFKNSRITFTRGHTETTTGVQTLGRQTLARHYFLGSWYSETTWAATYI